MRWSTNQRGMVFIAACALGGCQWIDPNLRTLTSEHNAVTVPGKYGYVAFKHGTSSELVISARDALARYRVTDLNVSGTGVNDSFADMILSLPTVSRVSVAGTQMTETGIDRMLASPSLRQVVVSKGQFSDARLTAWRSEHPGLFIGESILYPATGKASP